MKKMPIKNIQNFHPELKDMDPNSILERKALSTNLNNDVDGTLLVIASTPTVDRDMDIVHTLGIDTSKYNGVVCWNHDLGIAPIGKCIENEITSNGMLAKLSLSQTYNFAKDLYNLCKEDILKGISIGYIPQKVLMAGTKAFNDFAKLHGYITDGVKRIIASCELVEISLCPVACNSEALVLAAKSFTSEYSKKAFKIEDEVLTKEEAPDVLTDKAVIEQIVNENNEVLANESTPDKPEVLNDNTINENVTEPITESTDQIISNESTSDNITMDKEVLSNEVIIEKPIEEILSEEVIKTEEISEVIIEEDKVCKPKKSFTIIRMGKKAITPEIMFKSLKIVQGR